MRKFKNKWMLIIYMICCCVLATVNVCAKTVEKNPDATLYQMKDSKAYVINSKYEVTEMIYGEETLGTFYLSGDISKETTYGGITAYGTNDKISFGYKYDGSYQSKNKSKWNLISDNTKEVNGTELDKKIKKGVIIVQKSSDGENWKNTTDSSFDFSNKNKNGSSIYTTTTKELLNGTYYRIIVAYRMGRVIGEEGFFKTDVYEYRKCVEVYEFFVCSEKNPISIVDLATSKKLESNATSNNGFYIEKNSSDADITVQKLGGVKKIPKDYDSYQEPGMYEIRIKTKLGKTYTYNIEIKNGLVLTELEPVVYETKKNSGFKEKGKVSRTCYGKDSWTSLSLATDLGTELVNKDSTYGITGSSVSLYMKLKYPTTTIGTNWEVKYDKWGKKNKQKVNGVHVGEVGKGALIVQTSTDGKKWKNVEKKSYSNGLYTTDYASHYNAEELIEVYTPSGKDIIKGVHVRVYFAYQVYEKSSKKYVDCLEKYQFYLCTNELSAVTFHNLTTNKLLEDALGKEDEITVAMYRNTETMLSGDMTTTGFTIDTTHIPTVKCTVKKNGLDIPMPDNKTFIDTGKYEISLKSKVGDMEKVILYVDSATSEESLEKYFGDGFITNESGKRIYDEGDYPVFEGGMTSYSVKAVADNYLPLQGTITNTTTGKMEQIQATRTEKTGMFSEPGLYEVFFETKSQNNKDVESGDTRQFRFRFEIIKEGTAPGPVVNKENLENYAQTTIADAIPKYYGLTYQSAGKGSITLVFATRNAAREYAYNYEKGLVEKQNDGTYRYKGIFALQEGSDNQKAKYDDNWSLTDALNYYADLAVQELYMDFSDEFTYLTLLDTTIETTENLRKLELDKSVTIFAEGQSEVATELNSLPIINDKEFLYLYNEEYVKTQNVNFRFVKDMYGCDSYSVQIKDCEGKLFDIEYNKSVGKQLKEFGCATGIVTIIEKTIYGDSTEYQAIYIADNDNTAQLKLRLSYKGFEGEIEIDQDNYMQNDGALYTDLFTIASFIDVVDEYSLLIVDTPNGEYTYLQGEPINDIWSTEGKYDIKCVNRMGNFFEFSIYVQPSDNTVICFEGEGTENLESILAEYGEKNIKLPRLERKGFLFNGYCDDDGHVYENTIDVVKFRGNKILRAQWEAKEFSVIFKNEEGTVVKKIPINFGSSVDLNYLDWEDQYVNATWKMENEAVGNVIVLEEESDIILTLESDIDGSVSFMKNIEIIIRGLVIVVISACVLSVVIYKKRLKKEAYDEEN